MTIFLRSSAVRLALFFWMSLPASAEEPIALPSDAELRAKVKAEIKDVSDYYRREVKRVGNRTLELESVLTMPADLKLAPAIFSSFASYGDWVLPGLNDRPSGGSFLVQFLDLSVKPETPNHLVLGFSIDLPFFRKRRERTFLMSTESAPGVFTLRGETVNAADNVIAGGAALMKVFANEADPTLSWAYVKGRVRLESVIVYEALPEKILARETGDRIRILLENYGKEENRKRMAMAAEKAAKPAAGLKSSRAPKEKKAKAAGG